MTIASEYEAIATAHSANLSSAAICPIQTTTAAGRVRLCDRSAKVAAAMWGNGIDLYMRYGKELVG